jgi:hypothetical protein
VELVKVEDGWLWHNDMIGIRPDVGLGYFGRLVVGIEKCRMENIVGGGGSIVWCG